jgi:4-amino-4-deoxy-L-arabinose transferase-like glycosyltransferase
VARSWVWPGAVAAAVFVVLLAFAGGYGPHRDELYFIVAGGHPQFGYPDQPPIVPLVLRAMWAVGGGSLYLVRLPSAVAGAVVTLLAAAIAREAGGGRAAQWVAAGAVAASAIVLVTGHFVTTTTFDVVSSTLVVFFLVRALRRGSPWPLLWAGIATGLGFEAKPQVLAVAAALLLGLAIFGPRWVFRRWQLWAGLACAAALMVPYLAWQAAHGFPQLAVGGAVAGSANGGRVGFLPFQLLLVSPVLVPVWLPGVIAPWRRADERMLRAVPFAYLLLLVVYFAADGKAYYLASLYPALIALGALTVERWLAHRGAWRRWLLGAALATGAAVNLVIALPLLPVPALPGSLVAETNSDVLETVGWPQFTRQVEQVVRALPASERADAVILTRNYGEASDLTLYGRGLPAVYSGHNGYADWGPPPASKHVVIAVGLGSPAALAPYASGCELKARVSNPWGLDNQEHGAPIVVCTGLRRPWAQLWPTIVHYN